MLYHSAFTSTSSYPQWLWMMPERQLSVKIDRLMLQGGENMKGQHLKLLNDIQY
jgi:hypothetical protein